MERRYASRRGFLGHAGLLLGAAIAGPAFLSACSEAGANGGQQGQTVDASVQLGWLLSEGQLGEAVALAQGWYADNGIQLSINPGGPNIDGMALVAGGDRNIGNISSSPSIMMARSQGMPVKAFAVSVQQHPYAYISLPDAPVHEPQDLIGKTVGANAAGGDVLLQALLAANDIDPGDVEVVMIGADITPLTSGQVDVWTGWLSNVGAMRPLGDDYVSMRLWDHGVQLYGFPYYATEQILTENRDMLEKFVAATAAGWEYARDNIEEAAQNVADLQDGIDVDDVLAQAEVILPYVFPDENQGWGEMSRDVWEQQIATWDALGQFDGEPPTVDDVATFDILEATADDRDAA